MQHTIPVSQLVDQMGPQINGMAKAIESCVHCGFCLAECPTYAVLGQEMDSPRGRIVLMKSVLEQELSIDAAMPHIERCLGCLACVTACPSGVKYDELITPFRDYVQTKSTHTLMKKVQHNLIKNTLPYPERFKSAASLGRLARPVKSIFPKEIESMLDLLPNQLPKSPRLPEIMPAQGQRRARVALLAGCVQQVLAQEINWATLRVLSKNGVEVLIPAGQTCCGALSMHAGEHVQACALAEKNLIAFPPDVDAILTNAAGCGSGMKEYGYLFQGTEHEQAANKFASKVQDITEFLLALGLRVEPRYPQNLKVVYHDACHLAHAQGVTDAPRRLLASIAGIELLDMSEVNMCCGSAGTYNLEQPDIADELGRRKARHIVGSSAQAVAAGNIGCLIQIRRQLEAMGKLVPVFHTIELLDLATADTEDKLILS